MHTMTFVLTAEHVKLLRRTNVSWDGCEFGAPGVDPKRPYGNRDVHGDMAEILGRELERDKDGVITDALLKRLDKLHKETETALQVVLTSGSFKPGTYVAQKYIRNWRPALTDDVNQTFETIR